MKKNEKKLKVSIYQTHFGEKEEHLINAIHLERGDTLKVDLNLDFNVPESILKDKWKDQILVRLKCELVK